MTEHSDRAWARPDADADVPTPAVPPPPPPAPVPPPRRLAAGAVTRVDLTAPSGAVPEPLRRAGPRTTLMMFGWGAAGLFAAGLVVVLALAFNGTFSGPRSGIGALGGSAEDDNAPPLAKLCPPPTGAPSNEYAEPPPPPAGERTVDKDAGISYAAYGEPWERWNADWSGGDLRVHYRVGQHFITETYSGGDYHASILSGSVPATVNDGTALDLKCTGRLVTADVRRSYYPDGNQVKQLRDEQVTLGGRPAWVSVFRLRFSEPGLEAKSELVAVALIDVGRIEAAVLYVSIPDTHSQHDHIVDEVIASVRPVD